MTNYPVAEARELLSEIMFEASSDYLDPLLDKLTSGDQNSTAFLAQLIAQNTVHVRRLAEILDDLLSDADARPADP